MPPYLAALALAYGGVAWSRPEIWLLALALVPTICRAFVWQPESALGFGFYQAATPLRCEGLILGVWASFVRAHRPGLWSAWRGAAPYTLAGAVVALVAVETLGSARLGYTLRWVLMAAACASVLTLVVERAPILLSDSRPVFWGRPRPTACI